MIKFSQFLAEAIEDTDRLSHLEHPEDHVIGSGAEGAHHSIRTLVGVHHAILGHKTPVKLTTKYDGAPSLIFGTHPETKKFFVASKSAFNKTPKINYTHDDVDKNHGHAPGLADKLKTALTHLPKVTPKGRVFQGDVMYTKKDVETTATHHHFKPNTIQYSVKRNSDAGRKIEHAHVGVAVHTEYSGDSLAGMKAHFAPDTSAFKEHPDAHIIGTHTTTKAGDYSPKQRVQFFSHVKKAKDANQKGTDSHIAPVADHVKTYINHTVRQGTQPSVKGLIKHISDKHDAKKALFKTATKRDGVEAEKQRLVSHVQKHSEEFGQTLTVHKHISAAKHVLVKALSKTGEYEHSIDGKPTGPEGHVAILGRKPIKLVDRTKGGFSAQNMNAGGIRSLKKTK